MATFMSLSLVACGEDTPTGSIQFGWKLGFGVACNDPAAGIDTVRARLFNPTTKKDIGNPVSFQCGLFAGVMPTVPVGTFNVIIEGGVGAAFTQPVFTGAANGVVVAKSKPTELGDIRLAKIPPTETPGSVNLSWRFQSGKMCIPLAVAQVSVTAWREKVYLETQKTYDCVNSSQQLVLPESTYGFTAEAIDAKGRVVTHAEKDNVVVGSGAVPVEFILPDPTVLP